MFKKPFIPDDFKQPLIDALLRSRKLRRGSEESEKTEVKQNLQDLYLRIAKRVTEALGEHPTRQNIVAKRVQLEDWVKDVCSNVADATVDAPNFGYIPSSRYGHMRAAYDRRLAETEKFTTIGIMDQIREAVLNLTGIELVPRDDE